MADDDFGRRFRAFYDGCSPAEQEFLRSLGALADETWGELPEEAEVEGFAVNQPSSFGDSQASMGALRADQQVRMQLYLDRMSTADAMARNTQKKFSELSNQIIGNMK
jgi:hypothetical protein